MTIDLGLRYDQQGGKALPSARAANPAFPTVVPGIELRRLRRAVHVEERLAARRRDLCARRRAQDRGARELQPLLPASSTPASVGYMNPSSVAGVGGLSVARSQRRPSRPGRRSAADQFVAAAGGFNPANPTAVTSANRINPDLEGAGDDTASCRASIAR